MIMAAGYGTNAFEVNGADDAHSMAFRTSIHTPSPAPPRGKDHIADGRAMFSR
jgi:hypothetical protein